MIQLGGELPDWLFRFVFYYPLFMAYFWMVGALWYWYRYERRLSEPSNIPDLPAYPKVSLVVPCYNEEDNVRETIGNLLHHNYPDFEVIAINDGSRDRTGAILDEMLTEHGDRLKVIHQLQNQGKAMGLNAAALMSSGEFLICIDGDALLDHNAARWMLAHFLRSPRVGAVTGNPRIRNRSTVLGKLQVGEFSSIIGLIKRAQRTYGRLFTVSGVVAGFRKTALHDVGYWSPDMLTEDIDISWKLQLSHWDIRFEPAATCWILMPETIRGLWKQRLRWSMGGTQAILKYAGMWKLWKKRRMWPIYLEYVASLTWSYALVSTILLFALGLFVPLPAVLRVDSLLPGWTGVVIATTSLLQVALSLHFDSRYDHKIWKTYFWVIWYPVAYWLLNTLTSVWGFPQSLFRQKGKRAVWVSPDRGYTPPPEKKDQR